MKIATWNVNSLRVRLPHVLDWLKQSAPDVLALQETKLIDEDFPIEALQAAGYQLSYSGQKTYNGVAILSRYPMQDVIRDIPEFTDPQRRLLAATINDIRVVNVYIPNGESVGSEKFHYKLNWLEKLTHFLQQELQKHSKLVLLGDFNIAPADIDVHDPARWEGKILFSQPERQAFQSLQALGLHDCYRQLYPNQQVFTWWDYRVNGYIRKMGLRIDHILASDELMKRCQICEVDHAERAKERPSDHAPVWIQFSTT